jgi:hypothetical protein
VKPTFRRATPSPHPTGSQRRAISPWRNSAQTSSAGEPWRFIENSSARPAEQNHAPGADLAVGSPRSRCAMPPSTPTPNT